MINKMNPADELIMGPLIERRITHPGSMPWYKCQDCGLEQEGGLHTDHCEQCEGINCQYIGMRNSNIKIP